MQKVSLEILLIYHRISLIFFCYIMYNEERSEEGFYEKTEFVFGGNVNGNDVGGM